MPVDLDKFRGVRVSRTERRAVVQPLLGWRSRRGRERLEKVLETHRSALSTHLTPALSPQARITPSPLHPREVRFELRIAEEAAQPPAAAKKTGNSLLHGHLLATLGSEAGNEAAWRDVTRPDRLEQALREIEPAIRNEFEVRLKANHMRAAPERLFQSVLDRESLSAGFIAHLHRFADGRLLASMLAPAASLIGAQDRLQFHSSFLKMFDLESAPLSGVITSPIALVSLFSEHLFFLEHFLSEPVQHVWVPPGGTVSFFETFSRTDGAAPRGDDELAALLHEKLTGDLRLTTTGPFAALMPPCLSFAPDKAESTGRRAIRRLARQEVGDVVSQLRSTAKYAHSAENLPGGSNARQHTIVNNGTELLSYDLRRRQRRVALQLQDNGLSLCWQTFVMNPGDDLGLANLVHIAVPGDMPPRQEPSQIPDPLSYKGEPIRLDFRWPLSDRGFLAGLDPEHFGDVIAGRLKAIPQLGYKLDTVQLDVIAGEKWGFSTRGIAHRPVAPSVSENTATEIEVYHPPNIYDTDAQTNRQPLTDEHPTFTLEVTPYFAPSDWLLNKVNAENAGKIAEATRQQERAFKDILFKAAAERVTAASRASKRPALELRDEERMVVYRGLIRSLLQEAAVTEAAPAARHMLAELIEAVFDVERMVFFVAPEWWVPREASSKQTVLRPETDVAEFGKWSTVSWGGARASRAENYYITGESTPAPLGSSLGWVIQLDGDATRNAFLNAPWVKVLIPIREDREEQAVDLLSRPHMEGADGLDKPYHPLDGDINELDDIRTDLGMGANATPTVRDALARLLRAVGHRAAAGRTKAVDENGAAAAWLLPDAVQDQGFVPLPSGYVEVPQKPFEVFDQWIETVATDQIVASKLD